ncbi:MAG TPA: AAA family ATPase [Xanthobacteraceae bacterium]|nr:AAA family ATPase [Xanthobacteraceae bacterium]
MIRPQGDLGANADGNSQEEILKFLENAKTFGGKAVTRHDTHAAVIFLAGDRAIKIKRAVRFPFLDYSTARKRKAACCAELDANRRFAPQLYRGVVPITREADGHLALNGSGKPIEWAVDMRRFDETKTLDLLIDRGELADSLLDQLGPIIASMHENAPSVDAESWLDAIQTYIAQNTRAFREHGDLFPYRATEKLDHDLHVAYLRLRPILVGRGGLGLIRRGHGDLHLGNIALTDGKPVAFDALEFDPIMASGDVLYDLAFLLMDLVERGYQRAANMVFNGYFSATQRIEDLDGIVALPFFMSLRAAIRAKVAAARFDLPDVKDRMEVAHSARRYFQLALTLLKPRRPMIVCIGGLSGTGKTVLARALAPFLLPFPGALILRSDIERKSMFHVAQTDRLTPDHYRPSASEQVYRALNQKAGQVVRAGHSVIVDAVFVEPQQRTAIEMMAANAGIVFCGLFLVADLHTRLRRVGGRGPDASDADATTVRTQEKASTGSIAWTIIDASRSPEETVVTARIALKTLVGDGIVQLDNEKVTSAGRSPALPSSSRRGQR